MELARLVQVTALLMSHDDRVLSVEAEFGSERLHHFVELRPGQSLARRHFEVPDGEALPPRACILDHVVQGSLGALQQ